MNTSATSPVAVVALAERYANEIASHGWQGDEAQRIAVARLDRLRTEWLAHQTELGIFGRWRRRVWPGLKRTGPRGVYLWGGVGRGKTWLMDLFVDSLATKACRRIHFHHLMRDVHAGLAAIRMRQEPLQTLARRMARRACLWCIDELHVHDIADAMLFGRLFEALLGQGVTLVVTSNVPPADLYRDGLQRARFLPAIALLESQLEVLEVDAGQDYRLRQLKSVPIYLDRGDAATTQKLQALFASLASALSGAGPDAGPGAGAGMASKAPQYIEVNGRRINTLCRAGEVVWFNFSTLCGGVRSADDYSELARDFHTVFLSDVPRLGTPDDDAARRLISLVDEFYDRGVKLIVSAAAAPADLYHGERLAFEFRRTASRLVEMQAEAYLARPHRADPG